MFGLQVVHSGDRGLSWLSILWGQKVTCIIEMVKRPRGSAALVSPCWSPGIWPVFEDQSCNFLWFQLFSVAFRRLGQMNNTKTMIKNILLYPFMLYFFIIKWAHVLVSLFHHQQISLFFFFLDHCAALPIPSSLLTFLPLLTSSLLLVAIFCTPPTPPMRSSNSLSVALVCAITSFLPTAHPPLHKWEQREQRGERDAGPREQGLMKPA